MTGKTQDAGFRHPEAAAQLQSLTDEEAKTHPSLVRKSGGVVTRQRRKGGEVRCREVGSGEASAGRSSGMEALLAAAESEFGGLLPRLEAELCVGWVPDLDAFEKSVRDGLLVCGAKGCAALPEAFEAKLPTPCCGKCDKPMERHSRCGKTFRSRFGSFRMERTYCRCRKCGGGGFPLDIALGLADKKVTPGAESLCADVASSDSYEAASRKLGNLAGVGVPKTTLRRCSMRIGQDVQAFEREDAEAETPAPDRIVVGVDGTGVPMRASEVEGVAGKQADGTAKTREAKTIVCCTAESRDPKTGEPRKDKGSGAAGVRIDSARSADGAGRISDFAARLARFETRNGLFEAKELVVLSDGAVWIRKVFAGRVDQVIAELKPHRRRSEAVAACIDYFEANKDRMRCDLYRQRGLPVGSGVVESACKQIVGNRFKRAGCRWSKAGANALLAVKCCIENNRWADFLDWRAGRVAAA